MIAGLLLIAALGWADAAQACVPWRPKVYFQQGDIRALDEQVHILDGAASTMQRISESRLVLISHTETRMEAGPSQELAARRAEQISTALVERGVAPERISIRAEGASGMRDTPDVALSNYVWLIFTDLDGKPLTCTGT
jgi:hypothetical protein